MTTPIVLIVEDDPDGAQSVSEVARDAGFEVGLATTGREGVDMFRELSPDVVLTDLVLPDIDGIEVLSTIRKMSPQTPVLMMTAYGSVESSVSAMKAGAYDYATKPLDMDDVQSKLRRATEASRLRRQVNQLSHSMQSRYTATAMVAEAPVMHDVIRQIEALAPTSATVLIQGESGTGKELVARAMHVDSPRRDGPFVDVNCGAFAETLLESELFGHEKGAFTGASARHKGAFERADGGTLFLDEIGDAPASVQVKLLRALEEREIRRLGGQASFKVDVRLVSASNRDLDDLVAAGDFREDLLYRVNVVNIEIPPLRKRREDVRALADRFVAQACEQHGRQVTRIAPSFYEALERFDWPGNVRQLRNVVESAVILALTPELDADSLHLRSSGAVHDDDSDFVVPDNVTLDELEREILTQVLSRYNGNRTLTAEKLGVSRRTIQRKIKDHDLPF